VTPATIDNEDKPVAMSFAKTMALVFLPFACGYFFSYFYRTVNAVVAPYLRDDIGVGAADLGLLSAAYFLSFAAFQIPLGLLLDRYGPRRVQGSLYCLAAVGALLFAWGDDVLSLVLARAMIGFGVSGGLMAALKAIVMWFPRRRIAFVNGWYLASGGIGALTATAPVEFALQIMDWRQLFMILAAATLVAALAILLVVPERPETAAGGSLRQQIAEIGQIYRDPYFWRIVPLMFTCASANMAIQGLWAGPWLMEVGEMSRATTANHLLLLAIGLTIGVTASGSFAAALERLGLDMADICGVSALLSIGSLLLVVIGAVGFTHALWLFVGLVGAMTALVFAALAQHFPESRIGRANTAANVMVFVMAFAYQYGMGWIIELWPAGADGGYPKIAYVTSFLAAIATQVVAYVWFVWPIKGRYGR
jgi:MFS family permease